MMLAKLRIAEFILLFIGLLIDLADEFLGRIE